MSLAAVAGGLAAATYLDGKFHLSHDVRALWTLYRSLRSYEKAAAQGTGNIWYVFAANAAQYPDMVCIWTRSRVYTFREAFDTAARFAHFFRSKGVQRGDLVAFFLTNRAEFLLAWLGLCSIGCAPAAINYNLTGDALVHCLRISGAKLILVDDDADCVARMESARPTIESDLSMTLIPLDSALLTATLPSFPSTIPEDGRLAAQTAADFPAILLFTSGTTGMPKGCAFTMSRLYTTLSLRSGAMPDAPGPTGDRWYSCMPLYHGTSAICMIASLVTGVSIALGPKFSVRSFWPDIRDSESTVFVYVGESARYLLAAPPSPLDRDHRLRCMYGNGLRPDIWERFQARFGVPSVGEFFNSTEGVFSLFNYNTGPFTAGAVGHHGLLMRLVLHNTYVPVAIDPSTGDILRSRKTGFATRTTYAEGGEILVRVPDESAFQGYWRNDSATDKKFLRDVFKKGDIFYRSGDALRRAEDGRWYFLDRLGDTFRWKSENVATAEVAVVLGQFPGVQEANVYGVSVPHHEGRAGCAALLIAPEAREKFDFGALARFARAKLPKYAVPVFLRVGDSASHIHNHKQNKVPLREEGIELERVGEKVPGGAGDRFYWLPPGEGAYVPFGGEEWKVLQRGGARL
ncbi:putative very-long-chain acyl-CoA synthetase family protein (CefD1) [Aspergillus candidus]|uniref:Very long-chain fatty acid transport protein n=1 Tax=Aspergillus candidus TaxID=41067 RepID=A0A2I2FKE7_ASPCN|nr:acetyl-CoA synthetase-like protein [Aspergillus candidus]PLB41082.1 acetyl-CoA synthetase-like protein [Aspergillus candidus]